MSPQQTDVIEHHYKVYERLQKIKAETEEVSANQQKQKLVYESAQLEVTCTNLSINQAWLRTWTRDCQEKNSS